MQVSPKANAGHSITFTVDGPFVLVTAPLEISAQQTHPYTNDIYQQVIHAGYIRTHTVSCQSKTKPVQLVQNVHLSLTIYQYMFLYS